MGQAQEQRLTVPRHRTPPIAVVQQQTLISQNFGIHVNFLSPFTLPLYVVSYAIFSYVTFTGSASILIGTILVPLPNQNHQY